MDSEIKMILIELLGIIIMTAALSVICGMLVGSGAVDTKVHYMNGQRSCAVCEVRNDSN